MTIKLDAEFIRLSAFCISSRFQLAAIANELHNLGFSTRITDSSVLVALNRVLYTSEVREALSQVFDEIEFNIRQYYGKVKVS